jgi:Leucine-rich repeat (LRR) protein
MTSLPELPPSLTYLSCSGNDLTSLPSLPHGLEKLYCSNNPLESLPELPSTLSGLACVLPHNDQIFISNELSPEIVQQMNDVWMEPQSKERCTTRCTACKEQIMMKAWHPSRVEKLIEMGYDIEDM